MNISSPSDSSATAPSGFAHITVMQQPVVDALVGVPEGWIVDCTLGGGGHTAAILAQLPEARVLGLDRDPAALAAAGERLAEFGDRFRPVHASFSELAKVCEEQGLTQLSGVVADLGVSSHQLDTADRGFSFRHDGPLDMRMDPTRGLPLRERLAGVSKQDLADILYHYGDIRASRRVADVVLDAWQDGVQTTGELAARVASAMPRGGKTHPATLVFQALRMWVNDELGELETLLQTAPPLLAPGGIFAVISFHSGEDRAVKQVFREFAPRKDSDFTRQTKKPQLPSDGETRSNPRARSAKLRVLRRRSPTDAVEKTSKGKRRERRGGRSS
ncbi:MAG: 16S rRNA (cytosine(1402)-N(4))-methyltransferase RsmH [Myxococcales bacterium]|nr:16S rRNA (cytosine(1402)-N(4))-methyltransferase RsmH [Myxococcales bacterium]